jgi:hypothetical protein
MSRTLRLDKDVGFPGIDPVGSREHDALTRQ